MGNHPVDIHPGLVDHGTEVPDQSLICVSDNIVSRLIYEIVGYARNRLDTGFEAVNVALQLFVLGPKFEEMNRLRVDRIHGIRVVVRGKRGVRASRWVFVGDRYVRVSRNRCHRVGRARFAIVVKRGTEHARVVNTSGSDRRSETRGVFVVLDWVGEAALTRGQGLVVTKQRVFIPTR